MSLSAETVFVRQKTHRQLPLPIISIAISSICFALSLLIGETVISASPRMALFYSAFIVLLSLVTLVCIVVFQAGQTSKHIGYLILLLGVFYWFASPAMGFALASDGYVGDRYGIRVSREAVVQSCTYLALFLAVAITTYWLMFPRISTRINARSFASTPLGLPFVIFGLFFCGLIPYLVFSDGVQHIVTSLLAGRTEIRPWKSDDGALGNFRSAVYYFCISGFVAAGGFAGTWGTMMEKSRGLRSAYLGIFAFTTVIMYFDGGTRSWVALAVLPTVLAWLASTLKKRRLTIGRIVFLVGLIVAVQLAFEIARASRHRGWSTENARKVDLRDRHFDNDFFTDLAVSVELVPREHPYFYADDFIAFVTHPIPRFLWENKPISGILIFYNDRVHTGLLSKHGGNKLPSHLGQFYMSFGTWGVVLLGMLAGLISAVASGMIRSNHMGICHLGSLVAVWWFLMSRGVYPGWVYPVLFCWLILAVGFRQTSRCLPSHSSDY